MGYYPVFLDLRGRLAVVVGGGPVAEEKAGGLLAAGARLRVVAPSLTRELAAWAASGRLEHLGRGYRIGDLAGAFLAIAERDDPEVSAALWEEAEALGVPLNVVDDLPRCSFIAPALMRRGDLTVAISTAGKAPALAVRLKQELAALWGDHLGHFLEMVGPLRAALAARHPSFETRRRLWYRLVDSDVLELLERGERRRAEGRVEEILGVEVAS